MYIHYTVEITVLSYVQTGKDGSYTIRNTELYSQGLLSNTDKET